MQEPIKLDRTWLCSVVFMDIISYSRQSLEIQMNWKGRFNRLLAEAIKDCPENERVILDTGDGAAICFLGDPETAMFCALRFTGAVGQEVTPLHVRTGINLGSVKLVKDINGNLNAVGDGINVGQRVMSFAEDNQILVSRSFYEVASSLSEEYAGLFRYVGVQRDKHVREHTLYELHPPDLKHLAAEAGSDAAPRSTLLTAEQIARVEAGLTEAIGPIARHMVKNVCEQARSMGRLREALLALIPEESERESFLDQCGGILAGDVLSPPLEPSPAEPEKPSFVWRPEILEAARKDLAIYIGPMARVLVERAATRTRSRASLYQMLAEEIVSAKDREEFLRQVM